MMNKRPSGLGRGLGALIPPKQGGSAMPHVQPAKSSPEEPSSQYREIPISNVTPNPHQPRQHFDHAALEDLVSSIQELGIIEPLIVSRRGDGTYELIAGERRLRAARIAGLDTVPCVIREATEQDKLELAIIENVQRHDLNPIEEAIAYRSLMEQFHMTQDEVGKRVGKSRPQVANTVRLLQLPSEVQQALVDRKISASNARTLLSLPTDEERMKLFRAMLSQNFTVRETERQAMPERRRQIETDPNILDMERALRERIGHRVDVKRARGGGGEVRIHFHSDEELGDIASKLGG